MSKSLNQLANEVQQDEALAAEFQQLTDKDAFVAKAVNVAQERGYDDVTEADVRAWVEKELNRDRTLSEEELGQATGGDWCEIST